MNKKTKKILIISIAGLIFLRIFSLFLIPYLPHLEQYRYNNYLSVIHEGDDLTYYHMANMIYKFDFREDATMLGYPIMIVPFIFIFGDSFSNIFIPTVILNAIILFSLSIILIVWTSFLIFRKVAPAIFSGFLFVVFPFIFYAFRDYGPQFITGAWNDINFMHMNWLAMMADQPAAFLALLILLLLIIAEKRNFGMPFYSLIGFLAGYSTMVRITNVVFVFAAALVILFFEKIRKYKKLLFYFLFSLIAFLPQLIYNDYFFGSPLSFGYQGEYNTAWVAAGSARGSMWSFTNFLHLFKRATDYSWLIIPAFLAISAIILLGFIYIRKTNKRYALIAALWFFFPVLIYMFFQTGQTAMRYYITAVPAFIVLSVAALCVIFDWLKVNFFCDKAN